MSTFNPETFMSTELNDQLETKFSPVPPSESFDGDKYANGYTAVVDDVKVKNPKEGVVILDVLWAILEEAVKEKMNMDKVIVRQSIFLDVNDNGTLSVGPNKNVRLGRLREALGQNNAGPWSFHRLKGAGPVRIVVTQREVTKEGATEADIYNDVARINAL